MVRNKKRKTETHGQTDPTIMKRGVEMVLSGEGIRETAKALDLSKSSLQRYVKLVKNKGGMGKQQKNYENSFAGSNKFYLMLNYIL